MNGGGRADCQTDAAINDDLARRARNWNYLGGLNWKGAETEF